MNTDWKHISTISCWYYPILGIQSIFVFHRGHHNGPNTVSSSNITNPILMNASNNHHVLTPVPGDPSGRLVMTLLPSQGHDLMHGQHDPNIHHHSGASHTSSSHSTRYNHPGQYWNLIFLNQVCIVRIILFISLLAKTIVIFRSCLPSFFFPLVHSSRGAG